MSTSAITNVMLAVHEKKTNAVDLYKPIRLYISHHYSEAEAVDNEEDLSMIQQMRDEIEKTTDSPDARRDLLQRYFRALCVMESRFPISNEKEHINTISFTWFDAFKGKKASQQSIHYEKAAIMFNLGAIYSQLALAADRSTPNGIKQACSSFQAAAGAFAYLRDNISMKASLGSATMDVSFECAGMLEKLMLAQAQECFFEKVISDKKPPALCSKVAKQVGLYYEETHASLSLPPLSQHFDKAWVAHVQLKAAQFMGEAYYRASLDLHEKENIAEEIARLKVALSTLSNARKSSRGVVAPLVETVSNLEKAITTALDKATKENDRVYLMRIPSEASLAPLSGASLVKSTGLADIVDASKEKMFKKLVPDSSAKALSRYTELLDDVVRTQVERLQQESEITRVKLKDMNLPDSLHALDGSPVIPEQLRMDVESIQLDGGLSGLTASMGQLQDLKRVNEELLIQVEDMLQRESDDDTQLRSQFGSRWKRPPSSTAAKGFQERLSNLAMKLKQASDMDARIERSIKDNWELMSILDVKPIEASLPSLAVPIMSLNGDEDAIVGALKQSLAQLEALGSQRAGLEDALKEMKQKDNILPKILSTSGSCEDLFKRELAKYDPICAEVSKNVEAQGRLLLQIMMQNKAFATVFNLEDFTASCDRTFRHIGAAVAKYWEIRDNISNSGIKFYLSLKDSIKILKNDCSEYVMTRQAQKQETIESLQQQLAGFSFQDSSSMSHALIRSEPKTEPPPVPTSSSHGFYATGGEPFSSSQPQRGTSTTLPQASSHSYYAPVVTPTVPQSHPGSVPQHNQSPNYSVHLQPQQVSQHHLGPLPQQNDFKYPSNSAPQSTSQYQFGPPPQHFELNYAQRPAQSLPNQQVRPLPPNIDQSRYPTQTPAPYYSNPPPLAAPQHHVQPPTRSSNPAGQSTQVPAYYTDGPGQGPRSSYTVSSVPSSVPPPGPRMAPQQNYGQPPYSGWQGSHYGDAPLSYVQQPSGPPRPPYYQSPTPPPYYQPSHGRYYS
ncbi:hypothetical protein KP509_27G033300 [Ceratopteris richardii]|uniref:BRO1 domain-containing protein n=1 Tax=Ceratopteris richardii TaxID=49495 RepID=A0A8T2RFA0_CERRI|nr:hypothetical protein KP509_27G033300 [Ceratopteris richardii]